VKIIPKSSFDSSFPKRNRKLIYDFGDKLQIKNGSDTLTFNITSTKKFNLITNPNTGDTLFYGKVCMYRGLYYFNQQLNDSSYWIYAVKVTDKLIYGLNTSWTQTFLIDKEIQRGKYQKLVKYISSDIIRLHPDKKELQNLFSVMIDSIQPDTLLGFQENVPLEIDTAVNQTQIEPEDFEFFLKAYPNPTKNYIKIELQQEKIISYYITNLQGQKVLQGQLTDNIDKIDLRNQPVGIYLLTLVSPTDNHIETIKIIKN
jgi:hypothetical protein